MQRALFEKKHLGLYQKFKALHKAEIGILKHSGLKIGKELHIMDVDLGDDEDNYIHTVTCGDPKNPPLLLVHGYAGAAIFFYMCLKELSKHFKVYAIDFIGNGSSKRCKFETKDPHET